MSQIRHSLISTLTAAAVLGVTALAAHSPVGQSKQLERVVAALRNGR